MLWQSRLQKRRQLKVPQPRLNVFAKLSRMVAMCVLGLAAVGEARAQNQALSAVLFLYREVLRQDVGSIEHVPRARVPERVPVVCESWNDLLSFV